MADSSSGLIIGIIIFFVVIFIIIGIVVWSRRSTTSGSTTTTSSWPWILGAGLLIILVIAAVLYFAFRDDDEEKVKVPPMTSQIVQNKDGQWQRITQPPPVLSLTQPPPIIENICPQPMCPPGTIPITTPAMPAVNGQTALAAAGIAGEAVILEEIRKQNRKIEELSNAVSTRCSPQKGVTFGEDEGGLVNTSKPVTGVARVPTPASTAPARNIRLGATPATGTTNPPNKG